VARLKRNVLGNSDVGVLFVNRQGTGDAGDGLFNRSWGADATIRLLGNLILTGYLAGSDGSAEGSDGTAYKAGAAWRDAFWNTSAFVRRVDDGFDPGVGFVRRGSVVHRYATVGVHHQPGVAWMEEIAPYVEADYITDLDGLLETRTVTGGVTFTLRNGASLTLTANDRFERLADPFRIATGVVLDPGDYRFRDGSLRFQSTNSRALTGSVQVGMGDFWSGTRTALSAGATWRPRYDLFFEASLERNQVDLPEGSFEADVARGGVRYAYSTRLSGSAFVQYNRQTDQWISNVRWNLATPP
jgi:hypothetical protein